MVLSDGAKRTSADQLCLIVKKKSEDPGLMFAYAVEHQVGGHVSAILGYRGKGGDQGMAALLLHSDDDGKGMLSVWRNDGDEWFCQPNIQIADLPLKGTMQLSATEHFATLSIDGVKVVTLNAGDLGLERCDRDLGIRWIGSSICSTGTTE